MMSFKRLLPRIYFVTAVLASLGLLFFFVGATWIGFEVSDVCEGARRVYRGDCVEVLSAQALDQNQSFRDRNDAVWALGQLGDTRALAVVETLYTGVIPQREPYDEVLSQYELRKAVNQLKGGTNIARWVWRNTVE